ncbi:MAG: hypothetical protein AAF628_19170 [Planctomycetota bacterium]
MLRSFIASLVLFLTPATALAQTGCSDCSPPAGAAWNLTLCPCGGDPASGMSECLAVDQAVAGGTSTFSTFFTGPRVGHLLLVGVQQSPALPLPSFLACQELHVNEPWVPHVGQGSVNAALMVPQDPTIVGVTLYAQAFTWNTLTTVFTSSVIDFTIQ